jgi:hypothetical protein
MKFRNYILFGFALWAVLTAGFLFAFRGPPKFLFVVLAFAIVAPMWMAGRPGWMHQSLDDGPQDHYTPMRPRTSLILSLVCLCPIAWIIPSYYQRGEWMGLFAFSVIALSMLHSMYLAIQRWSSSKKAESNSIN